MSYNYYEIKYGNISLYTYITYACRIHGCVEKQLFLQLNKYIIYYALSFNISI